MSTHKYSAQCTISCMCAVPTDCPTQGVSSLPSNQTNNLSVLCRLRGRASRAQRLVRGKKGSPSTPLVTCTTPLTCFAAASAEGNAWPSWNRNWQLPGPKPFCRCQTYLGCASNLGDERFADLYQICQNRSELFGRKSLRVVLTCVQEQSHWL